MDFWSAGERRVVNKSFAAADKKGGNDFRFKGQTSVMLPRQRRVTRRQFPLILQAGRSYHTSFLSLRVSLWPPKEAVKTTLFAFVVSRKVAATAVDRNRLKRRARAIVRELLPQIKDNYACLLFFKQGATKLPYPELKEIIRVMFIRSSII